MKLAAGLLLLAAALPLRAQNLFIVTENGVRYPIKLVDDQGPEIVVDGQLRHSNGLSYSLVKAPIYGLGTVDLRAIRLEITNPFASSGQRSPQLHVFGRFRSDTPLTHCFFVLRVVAEAGKSVVCHNLPDLPANADVIYDQFFDLPLHGLPGDGKFEPLIFSNGLQLTTSRMSPEYIAAQRSKTVAYLQSHAAH